MELRRVFTGLIEAVGTVTEITKRGNYLVLAITAPTMLDGINVGDSIACDGVCLTVVSFGKDSFTVEVSQETIGRSIAGRYREGSRINLERSLRVGDRLGGHFVLGHVDAVGTIQDVAAVGESTVIGVQYDESFGRLVVHKGSITVNGVSLTINDLREGWCSLNLIPHTISATNLGGLTKGDKANLEFDIIGKYAVKAATTKGAGSLTFAKLIESGW